MDHRFGCLYDGHVLPLCNPILLRVVGHCQLLLDSYFLAKSVKFLGGILPPLSDLNTLNLLSCLIFYKSLKLLKLPEDLILGLHEVNLGLPRGIINKRYIVNVT
jgi:hypothetical protein